MTALPMIGRVEELSVLDQEWAALAAAPHRGPRLVVLSGEAGVGKTRLLAETLARLTPAPAVLLAGASRAVAAAPYDWLGSALAGVEPPAVTPTGGIWTQVTRGVVHPATRPGVALRAAAGLVRELVAAGPALIVVEDFHDLDPESLLLVAELARSVRLPAMIVVATRPPDEGAFPELAVRTLARLLGTAGAVRRHLHPLAPVDVAALLEAAFGAVPPAQVVRRVHERTGGNAFWLTELVATYRPSGLRTLGEAPLPAHLAALLRDRLTGQEPAVRRVAEIAAVLGDEVETADLAGISDEPVRAALDRLVDCGLLEIGVAGRLRFRHALVREAILGTVLPAARARTYGRALALAAARGDDNRVARYAHALGRRKEAASAALRAASALLAAGSAASALRVAEIGLDSAEDLLPLLRVGVAAATATGQFETAARYAGRWLEAARRGSDMLDLAAVHRQLAAQSWYVGSGAERDRYLDAARGITAAAMDLAVPGAPAEWGRYLAARAEALLDADDPAAAIHAADQVLQAPAGAVAGARDEGQDARTSALITRALAADRLGDRDGAIASLHTARGAARAHRDLVGLARAVTGLTTVRLRGSDGPTGWRLYEAAMATVAEYDLEQAAGKITTAGVLLAIRLGDLERARQLVHMRLPVETDPPQRVVHAAMAGFLALEAGDHDLAGRMLAQAGAEVADMDHPGANDRVALLRLAVAARTAAPDAARSAFTMLMSRLGAARSPDPDALGEAARWALAAGLSATEVTAGLERTAGPIEAAFASAPRTRDQVRCLLSLTTGRYEAARGTAARALDGTPEAAWQDAEVHLGLARCLLRQGDRPAAAHHAQRARDLLDHWPGWRYTEATALLSGLEAGADLTPREAEVLARLAEGMSNQQIASALGISIRTVAVHISSLFRKIGVASRTEAALWAVRTGHTVPAARSAPDRDAVSRR